MDINEAAETLRRTFPMLEVRDVEELGGGGESTAFTVNQDHVFLFPHSEKTFHRLQVQKRLLPLLQPHLPVSIPVFDHFSDANGKIIVGYPKLKGKNHVKGLFKTGSDEWRANYARMFCEVVSGLQSFPIDKAIEAGVQIRNFKKRYEQMLADFRGTDHQGLSPEAEAYVEDNYAQYLGNAKNFAYTPVLLHGDLNLDNILCDKKTGVITGIIDFGGVQIGDPAFEFTRAYRRHGEPFLKLAIPQASPELREKLNFFVCALLANNPSANNIAELNVLAKSQPQIGL